MPKQKQGAIETIVIDGREATTVSGARKLLNKRAQDELGQTREYSRDAVYAMWQAGKLEGFSTPSANYYYVDSLMRVQLDQRNITKPKSYTRRVTSKAGYGQEVKEQVLALYKQGDMSKRAIAKQLDVSYQTVNNWLREQQEQS